MEKKPQKEPCPALHAWVCSEIQHHLKQQSLICNYINRNLNQCLNWYATRYPHQNILLPLKLWYSAQFRTSKSISCTRPAEVRGYLLQWMLTKPTTFKPEGMIVPLKEYTVQKCPLGIQCKSKLNLIENFEVVILLLQKDKLCASQRSLCSDTTSELPGSNRNTIFNIISFNKMLN